MQDSQSLEQAKSFFLSGLEKLNGNNFAGAEIDFEASLKFAPNRLSTLINLSIALIKLKKFENAEKLINEGLMHHPKNNELLMGLVEIYEKLINHKPDYAEAYANLGNAFRELNMHEKALATYNTSIILNPNLAEVYLNCGNIMLDLKKYPEALENYDKAIEIKADFANAYSNRGIALRELNRLHDALISLNRAIKFKPDYTEAYFNRGIALNELKNLPEALASYDQAIEINPDYAQAYCNRGNVMQDLKRLDDALASFDKAIEISPDLAQAYSNRGNVLQDLNRLDDALASYSRAIEISPGFAEAYSNRGSALRDLKRLDEALENYKKALELKPNYDYLLGDKLHTKMHICDWQDFDANVVNLSLLISEGKKSSSGFPVLALTDSLTIHRKVSEIWVNDKHPPNLSLGIIPKNLRKEKIKIGYYSADFHNHATAYLMAELFEQHDKTKFELTAFSFGPDRNDEMHKRIILAFDKFIDVRFKSDKDIALMSREMEIDVAVDLKGLTQFQRLGIFSYRAAPIQVNYIGYPGSMGAEYIDYIIADSSLIPISSQQHYSEKVIYLPNSYQVNDRQRKIAHKKLTREMFGLPNDGFIFCCFNNNYKITSKTFHGWVRILEAVEGSVLWLLEDNATAGINLRKEARNRGIDPNRLVFAKRMKLPEHLARHRVADLFIDTLPYNAHTTASDALWAGLPVLTCIGESFASRVAASLLNAIELPELIAATQEQYEAKAIELATNPAKLKFIKDKLERNRLTTALFDTPRFTKHIEAAFTQIYERYQADLPPDHIYIDK